MMLLIEMAAVAGLELGLQQLTPASVAVWGAAPLPPDPTEVRLPVQLIVFSRIPGMLPHGSESSAISWYPPSRPRSGGM